MTWKKKPLARIILVGVIGLFPRQSTALDIHQLDPRTTLTVGLTKGITDISGVGDNNLTITQVNFLLYDFLFHFHPSNRYKYVNVLVKDVQHDTEEKEWVITLMRGATFHDGHPLTAEDVKISLDLAMKPGNPRLDFLDTIQRVEVVSRFQVRFHLKSSNPRFLENTLYNVPIVPKHVIDAVGFEKFKTTPVGSGPYKLVRWVKGKYLLLERNEQYWGGIPRIKHVLFKTNLSNEVLNIEVEAGKLDIVPDTEASSIHLGLLRKKVNVLSPESLDYYFLAFNFAKKTTQDVRFRKALLMAFNTDRFIYDLFYQNKGGIRAYSPIPPSMWPQDLDYQKTHTPQYNPQEAERLFKELEAEGTLDRTAPFKIVCRGKHYRRLIMQALAHTLVYRFGFKNVQFGIVPGWKLFTQTIKDAHIYSFGMGHDNPDPNIDIIGQDSPHNYIQYRQKDVNRWLQEERKTRDPQKRSALIIKITRQVLFKDYAWGMLFHKKSFFLVNKRVQGIVVSGVGYFYLFNPFEENPISAYIE